MTGPLSNLSPLAPPSTDDLETRIEKACDALRAGQFSSIAPAARFFGLGKSAHYQKFRRRLLRLHQPAHKAHQAQQLLTPIQEEKIVDWCHFLGLTGRPVDDAGIMHMAKHLRGPDRAPPNRKWLRGFVRRHKADIQYSKAAGLDPKRAQAFNYAIVQEHFELVDQVMQKFGIKWHNVYNMDEKGVQVGGGRKNLGKKYFWSRADRAKYVLRDANLELVTIIECVSADGIALPPGFIFQGKTQLDLGWLEVSDDIWYVVIIPSRA